MERREFVARVGAGAVALGITDAGRAEAGPAGDAAVRIGGSGRLKQSVARWCYRDIPLQALARACKDIGLAAIDLLQPSEWPVVADAGLVCSMGYPTDREDFLTWGFNDPAHHAVLLAELERTLPLAARAGVPNVIAMFGNRHGGTDAAGADACVAGLRRIAPLAEQAGVTVCVEQLNSRVDHPGYMGDHFAWCADVVRRVQSPRVKLLLDAYHMQIMDGDIIRTIRDNAALIGHYHTGGVPGRHELDATQELNWRAIAGAIADTGFTGYVAHEFVPTRDPLTSLREAFATCDIQGGS